MKAYCGSGGIATRILDLGTRWRCGQFHVPAALPPGEESLVPIGYEAGWAPKPVWKQW